MTERCDVCDSTEMNDTLADLGLDEPIAYWVKLTDPKTNTTFHRCSRCFEAINETVNEMEEEDEEELEDIPLSPLTTIH